ncbi:tryptophan synthase beta subunit-like PLP-dependent enzyme [Penicillium angulare]|uniref:tryptophan synthase beta subunit-like PLP-dependent enzyme n=1 Tax=Penicillium angulare TaxID=116970 RepID=UPI0025424C4E|nr:tryptophan synthase beta subunit-like PLP-dependent enzyme [Penicillium angulare]KAJ5259327.1 tryptophan synthase beta subunit-like PLP-dependent enzyme [Penicillium angulare]
MSGSVQEVYTAIAEEVNQTPLLSAPEIFRVSSLSDNAPSIELFLKCEGLQKTGSFKYRGAWYALSSLKTSTLAKGLVTTSSGNFGKALASAAHDLGIRLGIKIPLTIVMPSTSRSSKVMATKAMGANVYISGPSWTEREAAVQALQRQLGASNLSTVNNPNILLGQGTVGVEIMEQMRRIYRSELDAVIVPCGSGGLLAGTALFFHGTRTKVFGSEPSEGGADDARRGRLQKSRIDRVDSSTIADGLRCPVGETAWEIIQRPDYVEDVYAVGEKEIKMAMKTLLKHKGLVVEPSAAVALAAALFSASFHERAEEYGKRPYRVGVVLTGCNIDVEDFAMLLSSK